MDAFRSLLDNRIVAQTRCVFWHLFAVGETVSFPCRVAYEALDVATKLVISADFDDSEHSQLSRVLATGLVMKGVRCLVVRVGLAFLFVPVQGGGLRTGSVLRQSFG